ncbi:hypothetical protein TSOC_003587, partial [Tetrabaena socialis]
VEWGINDVFGFSEKVYVGRSLQVGFKVPDIKHIPPILTYLVSNATDVDPGETSRDGRRRCVVTRGTWCGRYLRQEEVPTRPVPRGSKECPGACSGWGNCNYDTGMCECPAGRGGPDCSQEVKRPCSNRYRHPHEFDKPPVGHIGPDKHDLDPKAFGWLASRCYGYCEDDLALCFCGLDSKYRHMPAPPGSPPWTPPVQWGRPMGDGCMIGHDKDGRTLEWGRPHIKFDDIYGASGWCNKPQPSFE